MAISGICHDFAFSRCLPSNQWTSAPSASTDSELWPKVQENMERVNPANIASLNSGVLTICDPARTVAAYCTHSYYVDKTSRFLLSTNDPFQFDVNGAGGMLVPTAIGDTGVVATAYPFADFAKALNSATATTARIGQRPVDFSFFYCDEAAAQNGWWN